MHTIIFLLLLISSQADAGGVFDLLSKEAEKPADIEGFFEGHTLSEQSNQRGSAKIIALNKTTASAQVLHVKLNKPIFFHNLEINLHKCIKINDPHKPDAYALLTLTEYKINDDASVIFQGWLIASSISISNFDHPIYEVFIKDCM